MITDRIDISNTGEALIVLALTPGLLLALTGIALTIGSLIHHLLLAP